MLNLTPVTLESLWTIASMTKQDAKSIFFNSGFQNTVGFSTYERIKHDIIFGKLAPGAKLKLETLKSDYIASITTLRETLNRLASDGYVTAAEQRGFLFAQCLRMI